MEACVLHIIPNGMHGPLVFAKLIFAFLPCVGRGLVAQVSAVGEEGVEGLCMFSSWRSHLYKWNTTCILQSHISDFVDLCLLFRLCTFRRSCKKTLRLRWLKHRFITHDRSLLFADYSSEGLHHCLPLTTESCVYSASTSWTNSSRRSNKNWVTDCAKLSLRPRNPVLLLLVHLLVGYEKDDTEALLQKFRKRLEVCDLIFIATRGRSTRLVSSAKPEPFEIHNVWMWKSYFFCAYCTAWTYSQKWSRESVCAGWIAFLSYCYES